MTRLYPSASGVKTTPTTIRGAWEKTTGHAVCGMGAKDLTGLGGPLSIGVAETVATMDEHDDPRLKVTVADLSNEQRRNLGMDDQGVLISSLDEGPAGNAGLYPDDIVLAINHIPVKNANQFVELTKDLPKGKAISMLVRRENESLYLAVRIPKD